MRFDSKSLLSTIQISHLEFTCRNIADWVAANNFHAYSIPETLPVTFLAGGNYGAAWRLNDYPGLVLKVCSDSSDGYPEYIRAVAKIPKPRAWMPKIFLHGGHEGDQHYADGQRVGERGVFWCVMPEYDNPWGHDACHWEGFPEDGAWVGAAARLYWMDPRQREQAMMRGQKLTRKQRKQFRQIAEFLRPMGEAGGEIYLHAKNALKDGEQWIVTDPIAGWHPHDKARFDANL